MRTIAQRHNMTLNEVLIYGKTHPEIDKEVDDENARVGREEDNLVIDARMAWFFIPSSFKVFLDLDLSISAQRVFSDQTEARHVSGEVTKSHKDLETLLTERLATDQARYKQYYDVDYLTLSNYDFVVDTSQHPVEEVADRILAEYQQWLAE